MSNNRIPSLSEYIASKNGTQSSIKLHLGCGGERWKDFINVDYYPPEEGTVDSSRSGFVPDALADMRSLGLPENSIDEIFTSHTIDHFPRWEAVDMFRSWHMMMSPGGRVIIEVADFWRCVALLFHPLKRYRWLGRSQFYGNQWDKHDYETHRYVWTFSELKKCLSSLGFVNVSGTHKTETHYPGRDMRISAEKL